MEPTLGDEDRDFQHSVLSGSFIREDERVDVEIYRFRGNAGSPAAGDRGHVQWQHRVAGALRDGAGC